MGETLKTDIFKYREVEAESLLRWFVELEDSIRALRIVDDEMQAAFDHSKLAGSAKAYALGLNLHYPYSNVSFKSFKYHLRQTFEPP